VEHFISILVYLVSIDQSVFAQIPVVATRTLSSRSELPNVAFARLLFKAGSHIEQGVIFESISLFYPLEFMETYARFCLALLTLSELDLELFLQFSIDRKNRLCFAV
jgi:hypothetical protein